jgi:homoserine kinase type II
MAVYTEVTAEELEAMLARYDIGALASFKGIAEGVENSNYFLGTERGQYILTLYERRVRRDDLPFFIGLMKHLAGAGISCPMPIADREGRVLQELAGRPAAIVTFLNGYAVRRVRVEHCEALGRALAALHLGGEGFALVRRNTLSLDGWSQIFTDLNGEPEHLQPGMTEELAREIASLRARWPTGLPSGVIHADLFPDNVFFLGNEVSGLIDFYFACNDILAYDIAICMNAWCFELDHAFNVTKARALLRGYGAVRPLVKDEIEALPALARGAALRFLLTRVYDWFNTPPSAMVQRKDPMEYWRKLRFHRTVTTASAYGI